MKQMLESLEDLGLGKEEAAPAPAGGPEVDANLPFDDQVSQELEREDDALRDGGKTQVKARKVGELRDYLNVRSLPVEDEEGKKYKKAELVEIVCDYLGL